MNTTIDAIYEDGVFRPLEPPGYRDHQRVRLHVELLPESDTGRRWGTAESLAQTFDEMEPGGGIDDEEWAQVEAELKRRELADTEKTAAEIQQTIGRQDA
jgi:predicted DNA-binding antitoxin AbrB/MazE fold protein